MPSRLTRSSPDATEAKPTGATRVARVKSPSSSEPAKRPVRQPKLQATEVGGDTTPSEPIRKRREYLRADERKKQIISAVQDVFAKQNLQGASTRELAKAADVNIATIFNLFGSKEELFIASVVEPMLDIMRDADLGLHIEDAQSSADMRNMLVPWMARTSQSMIDSFPLLTSALFSNDDIGKKLYCDHIYPLIQARAERIGPWFEDSADPELRCLAGFGIWFAIAMDRHFRGGQNSVPAVVEEVRDIVFADLREQPSTRKRAVASSKGQKGVTKLKVAKAGRTSKGRPV